MKNRGLILVATVLCMVMGFVGAAQLKSIVANRSSTAEQNQTLEELRAQLLHEIDTKNTLEAEIENLNDKIKVLEGSSLSEQESLLQEEYRKARTVAGLTDVTGDGLVIMIGENPNMTMSVNDLLQLINDLRMAEAQAISINDERIAAMTEIAKGDYFIVVNGNTVTAPYTIKVIGDPEKLATMVNVPFGVLSILERSGDWLVSVERASDIRIPKIKDGSIATKTDHINEGSDS